MSIFKKAERKKTKARIALCAPSGAGKTYSALLIAAGMGKKIAVIDTENGSAQLEAGKKGMPEFDVLEISEPFEPAKYIEAMKSAEDEGYDVIIVDSLSHAWTGSGGLLDTHDKMSQVRGNNSFTAWRFVTPLHNALVDAILQSKCHIISTMRTKVGYAMEADEKGRTKVSKVGMAPIQREGMDYEFTIVFDISREKHLATVSKDRTSLFKDTIFTPSIKTGETIIKWLNGGADDDQTKIFKEQLKELKMTQAKWEKATKSKWDDLSEKEKGVWIKRHNLKLEKEGK